MAAGGSPQRLGRLTTMPSCVLRLEPYRLRVFPGSVLLGEGGEVLRWAR